MTAPRRQTSTPLLTFGRELLELVVFLQQTEVHGLFLLGHVGSVAALRALRGFKRVTAASAPRRVTQDDAGRRSRDAFKAGRGKGKPSI